MDAQSENGRTKQMLYAALQRDYIKNLNDAKRTTLTIYLSIHYLTITFFQCLYLAYKFGVHGSIMFGNLNVRSPRAMIVLALIVGLDDFSKMVNNS